MAVSGIKGGAVAAADVDVNTNPANTASGIKDVAQGIALTAMGVPPPLAGVIGSVQNAVLGSIPEGPEKDLLKFLIDPIGSLVTMLFSGLKGPDANKGYAPPPPAAAPAKPKQESTLEDKEQVFDALTTLQKNFEVAAHADTSVDEYADYQYGISEGDLHAIVEGGDQFSPELKEAAQCLIDHPDEFKKMCGPSKNDKAKDAAGNRNGDVASMNSAELKGARDSLKAQIESLKKKEGAESAKPTDDPPKTSTTTSSAQTSASGHTEQADHLENAAAKCESAAERIEGRMDELSAMMDKLGPDGKYTEPGTGKVWTANSLNAEMTKVSNRYQVLMSQVNALNTLISNVSKMYSDMQMNAIRHIQ